MFDFKVYSMETLYINSVGEKCNLQNTTNRVEINSLSLSFTPITLWHNKIMLCFFLKQTKYGEFSKGECEHSSQTPLFVKQIQTTI